jgi:predicted ArsR family transcriptional regulator
MWCLTPAAESHFPDAHAGLTVNLLNAAEQTFGEEGVQRLVTRCAKQQIADYRSRIPARSPLQARLEALISIRSEEGFMAEVQRQRDGSFLLIENHCPISAAANVCPKLCEAKWNSSSPFLARASREAEHIRPAPVAAFTAFGQAS